MKNTSQSQNRLKWQITKIRFLKIFPSSTRGKFKMFLNLVAKANIPRDPTFFQVCEWDQKSWYTHTRYIGITFAVRQIERGGGNLPYRGAIPFFLHLVPWRLVSTFLYVGGVKISNCIADMFFFEFCIKLDYSRICEISDTFLIQMIYINRKLAKNYIN
jgi:hypothetical protein